jgi:hypothetical protein
MWPRSCSDQARQDLRESKSMYDDQVSFCRCISTSVANVDTGFVCERVDNRSRLRGRSLHQLFAWKEFIWKRILAG